MTICEWFLNCERESAGLVEHPTLGDVECCQHHIDWLVADFLDNFSPTKMVPPMVARRARQLNPEAVEAARRGPAWSNIGWLGP